jgi:hypothetical protein
MQLDLSMDRKRTEPATLFVAVPFLRRAGSTVGRETVKVYTLLHHRRPSACHRVGFSRLINLPVETSGEPPEHNMQPEMTNFQGFAASLPVEGEVCDLRDAKPWMQAADAEMAPLIERLVATSTAEIERLIAELQQAKDHLQSEGERIEREALRYTSLTQMASTTARLISDAVSQWDPAHNSQQSNPSKATPASIEGNAGVGTSGQHGRGHERPTH